MTMCFCRECGTRVGDWRRCVNVLNLCASDHMVAAAAILSVIIASIVRWETWKSSREE